MSVLSIEQCRKIAEQDLLKIEQSVGERLSLVPEVMELSLVVAFFYQGAAYLESGQSSDRLLGNGPILVSRVSGAVKHGGTAMSPEHYAREFENEIRAAASNHSLQGRRP